MMHMRLSFLSFPVLSHHLFLELKLSKQVAVKSLGKMQGSGTHLRDDQACSTVVVIDCHVQACAEHVLVMLRIDTWSD